MPSNVRLTIAYILVLLELTIASGCRMPSDPRAEIATGHVMILPGIGGSSPWIRRFARIINNESKNLTAEVWDWTDIEPTWILGDLMDLERNLRRADAFAEFLERWRSENPEKRLFVVATSGGAGIVLFAARKLPSGFRMDRVLFISPALSPNVDLAPIMSRSRGGVFCYRSPMDVLVLGVGTKLFGTTDRKKVASAGLVGFRCDGKNIDVLVWRPGMILQGNLGGHIGAFSPAFVRKFLLPLFEVAPATPFGPPAHRG